MYVCVCVCGVNRARLWRLGAEYFENQLLDYDCSSNWGNWVAAAGMTGRDVAVHMPHSLKLVLNYRDLFQASRRHQLSWTV